LEQDPKINNAAIDSVAQMFCFIINLFMT